MVNIWSDEGTSERSSMGKTVIDYHVADRAVRAAFQREEDWQSRHTRDDRSAGEHTAPGE